MFWLLWCSEFFMFLFFWPFSSVAVDDLGRMSCVRVFQWVRAAIKACVKVKYVNDQHNYYQFFFLILVHLSPARYFRVESETKLRRIGSINCVKIHSREHEKTTHSDRWKTGVEKMLCVRKKMLSQSPLLRVSTSCSMSCRQNASTSRDNFSSWFNSIFQFFFHYIFVSCIFLYFVTVVRALMSAPLALFQKSTKSVSETLVGQNWTKSTRTPATKDLAMERLQIRRKKYNIFSSSISRHERYLEILKMKPKSKKKTQSVLSPRLLVSSETEPRWWRRRSRELFKLFHFSFSLYIPNVTHESNL